MEFREFCQKICDAIGVELCEIPYDAKRMGTMRATVTLPSPKYLIRFEDLSAPRSGYYLAEISMSGNGDYVGSIACECNLGMYEHFESYAPELKQFYLGKSLKSACNSLLRGTDGRKPIRVW